MEYILSLSAYGFAILASPGPNNFMLMGTASRFGFQKTIPNLLGIWFGFGALLALSTSSIGAILIQNVQLMNLLKYACSIYLLYLSWRIYKASGFDISDEKPIGFIEASLFQLSNPKGWILAIATASTFWRDNLSYQQNFIVIIGALISISVISNLLWVFVGVNINRYFSQNKISIFNKAMAFLLAFSIVFLIFETN